MNSNISSNISLGREFMQNFAFIIKKNRTEKCLNSRKLRVFGVRIISLLQTLQIELLSEKKKGEKGKNNLRI